MKKPVLVIMAAGMGSRYGGLKQIDPIDEQGHIIIDFSLYDAKLAGFEEAVFIIKKEDEADFREVIGDRISKYFKVTYVYQDLDFIPKEFDVPAGRTKPWGTGHAVLSCITKVNNSFAVINADDYYGREAFSQIYRFLEEADNSQTSLGDNRYHYAMVGYNLKNTITVNGHVARGVCSIDENGHLCGLQERTKIEKHGAVIEYESENGQWVTLKEDTIVSMNMWGFSVSILEELKSRFTKFLKAGLETNPLKCEYFLPNVVGDLLKEDKATVKVLESKDRWYGVTYKEDKPVVVNAVKRLKSEGVYPDKLWN